MVWEGLSYTGKARRSLKFLMLPALMKPTKNVHWKKTLILISIPARVVAPAFLFTRMEMCLMVRQGGPCISMQPNILPQTSLLSEITDSGGL